MPAKSKSQQRLFGMVHAYQKGKLKDAPEEVKRIASSISDEDAEHFAKTKHKGLPDKKEKKAADRLYTYLPKDNTALTEGLLSTALSDKGFEKYRGRTGKYKKEDVLKVLDSWEPEWTRSKAISALAEPIPEDAAEDFLEFARNSKLYSFDTKDLIKAKILAHLRRTRKGGGTDPVDEVGEERPNWHRKKKHLLFQGVPHYMVETTEGKIPPEFVREEKKAEAHHPDIDAVLKAYKDRFGVDLSHVKFKWSRHPRYYDSGEVSREIPDDETGGSHGKGGIVWINPNLRPVMDKFNVPGKVKDFRRLILAHELAHEIDDASSRAHDPELVKRLLAEAKKNNFRTAYTDTYDPKKMPRKFDKELFAEYMANLLTHPAEKKAQVFSQDGKTVTLSRGQTPSHVVAAYNKAHPGSKITVPQFLKANGNLAATKFRTGKAYSMPVPSPAATASAKPVAKSAPAPVPAAAAPSAGPQGFRQHNPGNIRSDGKTRWQGATGVPEKGKFLTFSDPYHGIRAMARVLRNYSRHGIDTTRGVIDRYAPAVENNQKAYLASLEKATGLRPDDRIDLTNEATLQKLVPAMGSHEIGPRYFSTYDPSLVSNAVARAVR